MEGIYPAGTARTFHGAVADVRAGNAGGVSVDVDGRVLLADLERDVGIVLQPEVKGVETVGGYILGRLEHPPETGARVECEGFTLVVTDVAGRRVRRVRIVPEGG